MNDGVLGIGIKEAQEMRGVNRRSFLLAVGASLAQGTAGFAQADNPHRVLFLGNSVFYSRGGLHQSFERFCKADGLEYEAVSQWNQPENSHSVEFLNYGRIPLNLPEVAADEEIHSLIRSGGFSYVVLEGRRPGYLMPAFVDLPEDLNRGEHIPYEQNLKALAKLHRTIAESGAQTVLYMHPGGHMLPDIKHPLAQIYRRFQSDLEKIKIGGRKHPVTLVPASLLWLDAMKRYGVDDWFADSFHGTPLARYSGACMLYTYITGRDPRQSDFRELPRDWNTASTEPAKFANEKDAEWIKNQVWLYYTTRPQ